MSFFKWHFWCCCLCYCLSSLMPIPLIGSKFNNQKTINKSLEHANILLLHTFQLVLLFSGFLFPTVQDVPPNDVRQLTMKSQVFEWQLTLEDNNIVKSALIFVFIVPMLLFKNTPRPGYSHKKKIIFLNDCLFITLWKKFHPKTRDHHLEWHMTYIITHSFMLSLAAVKGPPSSKSYCGWLFLFWISLLSKRMSWLTERTQAVRKGHHLVVYSSALND